MSPAGVVFWLVLVSTGETIHRIDKIVVSSACPQRPRLGGRTGPVIFTRVRIEAVWKLDRSRPKMLWSLIFGSLCTGQSSGWLVLKHGLVLVARAAMDQG